MSEGDVEQQHLEPGADVAGLHAGGWLRVLAVAALAVILAAAVGYRVGTRSAATAGMAEGGAVHWLLFCADAGPGKQGGVDVRDAVDTLAVQAFPYDVNVAVVVLLTPDRPGRTYRLLVTTGDGRESGRPLTVAADTSRSSLNVIRPGIVPFTAPGVLRCRVLADGNTIAERELRVTSAAGTPTGP